MRVENEDGGPVGHPRFLLSRDRRALNPSHPGPARWRLLSANNHQLGRSAGVFDELSTAAAAARELQAGLDSCEQIVVRLAAPGRWVWSLLCDGQLVAVSGRSYEAERTVNRALEHFLAGVAQARPPVVADIPQQRPGIPPTLVAVRHVRLASS